MPEPRAVFGTAFSRGVSLALSLRPFEDQAILGRAQAMLRRSRREAHQLPALAPQRAEQGCQALPAASGAHAWATRARLRCRGVPSARRLAPPTRPRAGLARRDRLRLFGPHDW